MKKRRILIVWSGPETGTSANLFKALAKVLSERHVVTEGPNDTIAGTKARKRLHMIHRELRRWPMIFANDVVILHSYVALAFPSVLLAWVLRKRLVVVHWDVYPITVDGKRLGGRGRALFDRVEQFAVRLATRVVLPTEDFTPYVDHPDVKFLPLWPSLPLNHDPKRKERQEDQPVRLAFVGQTHLTRGLPDAIKRLNDQNNAKFELHLFSPNPPEPSWSELASNVDVNFRGYLSRDALQGALEEMDFGLISLHPKMGQPGFPSKVFDYVAAGLPVLYTGRPLPAFEALLSRTGVGFSLRDMPIDWLETRQRLHQNFAQASQAFEAETSLAHEKLEKAFF